MRKYRIMICVLLLLLGCSQPNKEPKKDVQETEKQEIVDTSFKNGEKGEDGFVQLNLDGLQAKLDAKETFVVMISQSTCTYCNSMKLVLYPYFKEHPDIAFYEIEMDQITEKKQEIDQAFSKLEEMIPSFSGGTPEFFYFEAGEMKDSRSGAMSKEDWHEFLKEHGLVDGEVAVTTMAESEYLTNETFSSIAKKISNKNEFYLLCVEEDKYGIALSEKLKRVIEERKQNVFVLNFTSPKNELDQTKMEESYTSVVNAIGLNMTPTLYHIQDGKVTDHLVDNVTEEEIIDWFKQQSETKEN